MRVWSTFWSSQAKNTPDVAEDGRGFKAWARNEGSTPLSITLESSDGAERHAIELLALTKLSWNHSRLDGHDPITTHAARAIGSILRHVESDGPIGNRYAFYM